jgi:hypothetical protein
VSIFIDRSTKLIVQGITGRDGSFHTKQMIEYGTKVVGGVTPGKGGQTFEGTVPIFNTVHEAVKATGANTSVIYVPPVYAADAMMEAADAGVQFIVAITEGVPVLDMTRVYPFVKEKGARLLGPNCPGTHHAGAEQGRHHPGPHLHAGQHRGREPLGNAHLRSRLSAHPRRHGTEHLRGDRRRSDQRDELHRLPVGVREGSEHEGGRDDG